MKTIIRKTALTLSISLLLAAMPSPNATEPVQAAVKLSNPAINYETVTWTHPETGETITEENTTITWDTIWFGSYPQAEVMTSEMVRIAWNGYASYNPREYLEDDGLYYELKNAKGWNKSNEITIRGTKYRRMQWKDTAMAKLYYNKSLGDEAAYLKKAERWVNDTEYRYFVYQPIRWRVLSTDGKKALLLPDTILDAFGYRRKASGKWSLDARWEKSIFRDWLNGYKTTVDKDVCMTGGDFIHTAFSKKEQKKIAVTKLINKDNSTYGTDAGKNTKDKVFLLSEDELFGTKAKKYGILQHYSGSIKFYPDPTGYAEASYRITGSRDNLLTRTPGKSGNTMLLAHNLNHKYEKNEMDQKGVFYIQPAITLDLSGNKLWDYAGAVQGRSFSSNYHSYPTEQIHITGNTDTLLAGRKVTLGIEEMPLTYQKSDII